MRAESPTGLLRWHLASTAISTGCKDESNFHGDGLPSVSRTSSTYLAWIILKCNSKVSGCQCRIDNASFMPVGLYPFIAIEKGSGHSYYQTPTVEKSVLRLPILYKLKMTVLTVRVLYGAM